MTVTAVCKLKVTQFWERASTTHILDVHFQIWVTVEHVTRFGWLALGDLRMNVENAKKTCRWLVKSSHLISAVRGPKFSQFYGMQGTLRSWLLNMFFRFSIARFVPLSRDVVVSPPENRQFWWPTFWREETPKFWTLLFKSGSLQITWQSLVKFCLVTFDGGVRKKKEIRPPWAAM